MPRAKAQSSLSKNQMQLAIALSSSLEESKKLEISNLTEALPVSTIEDGTVPQSIKQMQKEFLERLKLPKQGPTKKSKKPPKPVPTLLVRSSEERLRIITEKVALVLIKDDCNPSSAKDGHSLKLVQDDGQESVLWSLSWMLSSDKNLYYIDCLATFISPSEATTGPKSNNSIPVARKLMTPVKYRMFRSEALHHNGSSQSSTYEEHDISSYNEKQADHVDPDFQAQSELQNDWQRMLNNSKLSDITIVVKEGSRVFAHKLVLFVRCPSVIEELDDKNMLHWTTVAHSQAMAFLEYLYSGKLSGIRALGGNADGVVLLARKYKITELLKFLLISDFGVEVSDATNCDIPTCSPRAKTPIKSGTISPDLFADPEETIITNDKQPIGTSNEPQISIEISSDDEGDGLLYDFFGTCNPTMSSPITVKSDSEQPEIELLEHTPMDVIKEPVHSGTKASQYRSTLQGNYNIKKQDAKVSDEDTFFSPKVFVRSPKRGQSPETSRSKNHVSLNLGSSDEELNETGNTRIIKESDIFPVHTLGGEDVQPSTSSIGTRKSFYNIKKQDASDSDEDFFSHEVCARRSKHGQSPETSKSKHNASLNTNLLHIEGSSDEELNETHVIKESDNSYSILPVHTLVDEDAQPSMSSKGTRKSLFKTSKEKYFDECNNSGNQIRSFVDNAEEDYSRIFSTPCTKRKPSNIDGIKHSSFYKRRRALNESVSLSSSPKLATASCSDQNQSTNFDDSFSSVTTRNFEDTFEIKNVNSPNKVGLVDLNESDYNFQFPKKQISSPSTNDSENERKLLDDSFNFDINDSVLLKHTDGLQTPESKSLRLGRLRTPLDSVKTSSPVTPMPDYDAMTNEQFEMELQRFGLKRGLSRSKGIKMLTHIYGKLHPLVEVVTLDGKQLLIPLGERTPGNEQSPDDEPLSQRSVGSSDDDCIMLEETILDEEEDLTQGKCVSSKDLKTAVRAWITSQPEIHEMILSYEPIWLDSFHIELKSQFDKRIKVNQLMDVLDEEGITFRSAQGQPSRRKKRNSPKKKRDSPKKLHASPKKKLPGQD